MSGLMNCGVCCMVISIWGTIQLDTIAGATINYYLVPNKSRLVYIKAYDEFCKWKNENQASGTFSVCFPTYFNELSEKKKSLTFIMGICYKYEVVTLLEDVEEEEYEDYNDFISKTRANYAATSGNCFIASAIYAVLVLVSYGCIKTASNQMKEEERKAKDDELFCMPKPPPKTDPKKIL